jgi:hypothetical protein
MDFNFIGWIGHKKLLYLAVKFGGGIGSNFPNITSPFLNGAQDKSSLTRI